MDWPSRLCTTRLLDQNFGMCLSPDDLLIPFFNKQGTSYFRPWKLSEEIANKDTGSTIDNTSDNFKISLDVQHFKPDEISVKINNNEIIIEGKHEERKDEHGFISRQFVRKYTLPKDCISESVISTLSSDGVLSITANKKTTKEIQASAKTVPITMTGACRKDGEEKKIEEVKMKGTQTNECEMKSETNNELKMKKELKSECAMKKENQNDCEKKKESKNGCEKKKENKSLCEAKKEAKNECKIKTDEKDKKDCQLMLKEEHSRLLKPELLGEAANTLNTEKLISDSKKETDELLRLISADKAVLRPAAEKLDEVIGQCKTAINELKKEKAEAMSVLSGISNMQAASEMTSIAASEMSSMKSTMMSETMEVTMSSSSSKKTEKTSDIVSEIICAELKEAAAENV